MLEALPLFTVSYSICTCHVSISVHRWWDRLCWYLWKHTSSRCCQIWSGVTDQHSTVKWFQQGQVKQSRPQTHCLLVSFKLLSDTITFSVAKYSLIIVTHLNPSYSNEKKNRTLNKHAHIKAIALYLDVQRQRIDGMLPLHLAALYGFPDCCRKLLSNGKNSLASPVTKDD